jgi:predicted AlkP superfamily phosphohydrolase/phosphomutase
MATSSESRFNRRKLLQGSAVAATLGAAGIGGGYWLSGRTRVSRSLGKKVIIIGIDGMDPRLTERMMNEGELPHLSKLRGTGGFSPLGTSVPPQSPVAWANFINGSGPGSHGIFDFIHRHPQAQCEPFYAAAETIPGHGGWELGEYNLQLDFWPFNHQPSATLLRREGTPFWDYLDDAKIPSTFYDLPSNYPPSPSKHGYHRCISGMGTPDLAGSYGTYQHFAENGPSEPLEEGGGRRSKLVFESDSAKGQIIGPQNTILKEPKPVIIDFQVHRDRQSNAALVEIQDQKILLKAGEWSPWLTLDFALSTPRFIPNQHAQGICRFYLQQVNPFVRLYVSPINIDPSKPAVAMSEPDSFLPNVAERLGLFGTLGFQEDHKARSNGIFIDDEFRAQAEHVLEERLALFDYAVDDYDDGLLFFYFSSSDLQSHMFWWDSDERHPVRSTNEAKKWHEHVRRLYKRLDQVIGDVMARYDARATIIVMSDHGFANFGRQFNLNSFLRYAGYLGPPECTSIMRDVDWSQSVAYGLGINGLYLNLKGRERDGIVEPGEQRESLLRELIGRLESITDYGGKKIIRGVYRSDEIYQGNATRLAPDLIVGYSRGYRASWATCLGDLTDDILLDNDQAWSADHCCDALEVPGVLFSNRAINGDSPSLVDVAPSILAEYGISTPASMSGKSFFTA